jgi:hypothetical protein
MGNEGTVRVCNPVTGRQIGNPHNTTPCSPWLRCHSPTAAVGSSLAAAGRCGLGIRSLLTGHIRSVNSVATLPLPDGSNSTIGRGDASILVWSSQTEQQPDQHTGRGRISHNRADKDWSEVKWPVNQQTKSMGHDILRLRPNWTFDSSSG